MNILVAAPIHQAKEYCMAQYLDLLSQLTYPQRQVVLADTSPSMDFFMRWRSACTDKLIRLTAVHSLANTFATVARALNYLRNRALTLEMDWLCLIEMDNIPPLNVIELLLEAAITNKAGVVITTYWTDRKNGNGVIEPSLLVTGTTDRITHLEDRILGPSEAFALLDGSVKPVYGGGFGTCLIRSDVLKAIPFHTDGSAYPDSHFFARCMELRVPVALDTRVIPGHINHEWLK